MPESAKGSPDKKSLWIVLVVVVLGVPLLFLCCGGIGIAIYFFFPGGRGVPGFTTARIDPNNIQNTRAWAEATVKRLKELDAKGDQVAVQAEMLKAEDALRAALLNKKVHWAFEVNGVEDNKVDVETFFGIRAGNAPPPDDPQLKGKPVQKLYLRVFFHEREDGLLVGRDFSPEQAKALRKGTTQTLDRTVTTVEVRGHDGWFSRNPWTDSVDVQDAFCVDIILTRVK